ncbi:hypothetical protein TPSD3_05040 [Thioflexithrix psekupsensis]|uniref:Uncharacterized protein n=2 Tax=Thioflexithrix psekupsensis TaxID=1570016 RepID=A0A251XAQ8_9GAMM|nr:hypothetical protein TPSD3_05040 [Thioflexithrix psekupsensis]
MRTLYLGLLCFILPLPTMAQDDIYLEGISVLGDKKTAHVVVNGTQFMVKEQDYVGEWQVNQIEERTVMLSNEEGKISTLALQSRLTPVEETPADTTGTPTEPPANTAEVPASGEDIPEGYQKVRTPFGDLLVRKKEALDTAEPPPPAVNPPTNLFNFGVPRTKVETTESE